MQTQQQSPFVRPPHPPSGSHLFSHRHSLSRRHTQSPYFKPVTKQKETHPLNSIHEQQSSGDRLSALHSRLQVEAEKIRKWKNATEVDIREKDRRLEDAHRIIDRQRKSLTELQLLNESLNSRLKDEVANQHEIQRKVGATRDLCSILKNHMIRVEEAISKGEHDRQGICQLNQNRLQQHKELVVAFQALELHTSQREDLWRKTVATEHAHQESLAGKCITLQEQLDTACAQLSSLRAQYNEVKESKASLAVELEDKAVECSHMEAQQASIGEELSSYKEQLQVACERVDLLEGEGERWRHRSEEVDREGQRLQALLKEKASELAARCDGYESVLAKGRVERGQMEEEMNCLTGLIEQSRAEKETLLAQVEQSKAQLRDVEEALSEKVNLLEEELTCKGRKLSQIEEERSRLEVQVTAMTTELAVIREEMDRQAYQATEKLEHAQLTLEERCRHSDSELQCVRDKCVEWEERCEGERKKLGQREVEFESKLHDLKAEVDQAQDSVAELREAKASLEQVLEVVRRGKDEMEAKQKGALEVLKEELAEREQREASMLQSCQVLKGQVTRSEGEKKGEVDGRREAELAVQSLQEENQAMRERVLAHSGQTEALQHQLQELKTELATQLQRYKTEAEAAREEGREAKSSFEAQVNTMCATLKNYSAESQKVITQKDREMETLKQQLSAVEGDRNGCQTQLISLTEKLQCLEEELRSKVSEVAGKEEELRSKSEELKSKDEELQELLKAVECVQAKPSCVVPATPRHTLSPLATPHHTPSPLTTPQRPSLSSKAVQGTPKGHQVPSTPRVRPHTVTSTPQTRVYNYRVSMASQARSRPTITTPAWTPGSWGAKKLTRGGRSVGRMVGGGGREEEKLPQFYHHTELEDEEAVFRRPKAKLSTCKAPGRGIVEEGGVSHSNSRRPMCARGDRLRKAGEGRAAAGKSGDLSWFELDSVYGFGPSD